ncbi:ABC transporter ATP-binding protein [Paenibacillus sp. Marseille-Q4541]|uniref:ABC transporter ATP-binding protein n=1 Tax=Paenibacillus sp. Marseille-Q4541 TaxID=2831522 RepID=UPI001BA50C31|nr:ABC transporter ATP-binding protein [Paenibacillus sp. Marseille-Q4541]
MNEIVRLVKPLLQERKLVIVSVTVGGLVALLNLSRPILLGRIIQMLTDKSFTSAYEFLIMMFVLSWILSWLNFNFWENDDPYSKEESHEI